MWPRPHSWHFGLEALPSVTLDSESAWDCVQRVQAAGFEHPWDPVEGIDRVADIPAHQFPAFDSALADAHAQRWSEVAAEVEREVNAPRSEPWVQAYVDARRASDPCLDALGRLRALVWRAVDETRPSIWFDL